MEEELKDFKVPILPGPQKKIEENPVESKRVQSECPYLVPKWSGPLAPTKYSFEILKNGVIIDEVKDLHTKPFWIFGRLPLDIVSAHPTTSRFHCVLQYKQAVESENPEHPEVSSESGWFVYDLDSTHGTFVNKNRIRPKTYVRIQVGHQLKLGNSTRAYILQGPTEDEEEESELTVTEIKQQRVERELEKERLEQEEKLKQEKLLKEKENEGISWGMAEDAEDEPDLSENPYAATNNEELFLDDPKKTLRGYFEREGHDLNYRCDELSPGTYICRIDLPIDDEFGKPMVCEVQHKGKKKECVVQCALEACRLLDRQGVLRQSHHEPRRKKRVSESDSDDDLFFDRTGDVEKKRLKKSGQQQGQEALTYEQLTVQEQEIQEKISSLELKLDLMIENERRQKQQQKASEEDLDSFMSQLSHDKIDKFGIRNTKMELQNLKVEHAKIQKLVNIAKPSIALPPVNQTKGLPLFGKRKALPKDFGVKKTETISSKKVENEFKVEEDEEEIVVKKVDPQEVPLKIQETKTEPSIPKKPKLDEPQPSNPQPPPSKKKSRPARSQNRYRANIDINDDDEYIDEDKVSMWVAPDNQRGDGFTHLNDKFGY